MNFKELFTFENLNNAFYETAKISYWKESTQRYKANLFHNNLELQDDLMNGTYKVSATTNFQINERGKIRNIEAPAIRDRIVQKVLCKYVLLPQLKAPLIYDNYASLKNRGTSFARKRIDILIRRYLKDHGDNGYILKIDIKKYFESIDHDVLKSMVHKRIHESEEITNLIDYFVDTSSHSDKGLNLGSEAPQIFAIFYLSPVDTFIKTVKSVKYYGRYMDDIFIISDSKEDLKILLSEIKEQLAKLKLSINEKKTHITTLKHGFTYLQIKYQVSESKIIKRPTRTKIVRERRRLKKFKTLYDNGLISKEKVLNCYKSWRNGLMVDCNACTKTINSMDRLFKTLFPNCGRSRKLARNKIVRNTFKTKGNNFKLIIREANNVRRKVLCS